MIRIAICQRWMKHYRVPAYDLLGRQPGISLTIFSAMHESVLAMDRAGVRSFEFVESETVSRSFPPGFFHQPDQIDAAAGGDFDLVILPWDIHYLPTIRAAMRRRASGVKIALWGHGYSKSPGRLRDHVRNRMGRAADGVLLYSHTVAERLIHGAAFPRDRVFVAQNTIDQSPVFQACDELEHDPASLVRHRVEHGIVPDRTAIFVSRLLKENRLHLLPPAFHSVRKHMPEARLVIIGDGEVRGELEAMFTELGDRDAVLFTGELWTPGELAPWMLSAAMMVYPASIGLSLHQAFGFGLPVITSDDLHRQNPEIEALEPERTGLLYRHGDVGSLADAWLRLLRDDNLRSSMRSAVLSSARERYTLANMVQGFLDLTQIVDGVRRVVVTDRETAEE